MANSKAAPKNAAKRVASVDPLRQPTTAALDSLAAEANVGDNEVERWVRNDPVRISQLKQVGYEVKKVDGENFVSRDMILMVIPRDLYDQRVAMKSQRTTDLTRAGTAAFEAAAQRSGVSTEDLTSARKAGAADTGDE